MANEEFNNLLDKVEELKSQYDWLQDEFKRAGDINVYTNLYNEVCQLEDSLTDYPNDEEKYELLEELKGLNEKIDNLTHAT